MPVDCVLVTFKITVIKIPDIISWKGRVGLAPGFGGFTHHRVEDLHDNWVHGDVSI